MAEIGSPLSRTVDSEGGAFAGVAAAANKKYGRGRDCKKASRAAAADLASWAEMNAGLEFLAFYFADEDVIVQRRVRLVTDQNVE